MSYKLKLVDENGAGYDALIALIDMLTAGTNITIAEAEGTVKIDASGGGDSVGVSLGDKFISGFKHQINSDEAIHVPAEYEYHVFDLQVDGTIIVDGVLYLMGDSNSESESTPQTLSLAGHHLSISDGNSVLLPIQLQSDWEQSDTDAKDYIKNKIKNLIWYTSAPQPFFNIQTTPPGEPPITEFVKIGDLGDPPTGETNFKNILLGNSKQYYVDINILLEGLEEGRKFELRVNGNSALWSSKLTCQTGFNLKFTTVTNTIIETNIRYLVIGDAVRFQIYDNPTQFTNIRITGYINTQTAPDTELSVSCRNVDTISDTLDTPVTIQVDSIIHSTICN